MYPNGIKKGNEQELNLDRNVRRVKDKKGKEAVQIQFTIDKHLLPLLTSKSEIIFATRLALDSSAHLYFPYPLKGEERWFGTKVKVQRKGVFMTNFIQNRDVKFASLYALQDYETWK